AKLQAETDATMAENNVAVLATNKGSQIVQAPFSGRVTARFVDVGAFITAGATTFTSASPIVTISDDIRVKIFLYIQQVDAPFVQVGDQVEVADSDNPTRTKLPTLTPLNSELDAPPGALLAEVHLDNTDGFLVPGSFAQVKLNVPIRSNPQVPVTALLTRGDKNYVAVLDKDRVRFKPVKIIATDGATITIGEGLQVGE